MKTASKAPRQRRANRALPAPPERAQESLLPFLLNPASYPHRPKRVRLVQTHSSFVLIVPPFVYKVKKAVNFGFLNFSTLALRRHFCEREVQLNRRLCPQVYLGVIPISLRAGRYVFGEGDEVVEYAVHMRKLADGCFLDQLVERDAVTPGDIDRIALALKSFYLAQHPTEEIEAWGRIERLRISTDENFRQAELFLGGAPPSPVVVAVTRPRRPMDDGNGDGHATLSAAALATTRYFTEQFYGRHRRLFASRLREKWIRDCHGDLHLEHIHLTPRSLRIFDCIEFNDRFRYIDVANDAAFLAMDLDYEGRPDLARRFCVQLALALNDEGMPRVMDFYKCYRAFVRGKVESLRSVAEAAPAAERGEAAARSRRYFQLALRYAVAGSAPRVVAVMGRIASGKSALARALGAELGWECFSSDRLRKELAGFPLFERSSAAARERLYSASMTGRTYERLLAQAETRVRAGPSVLLDATFARRSQRRRLAERFEKLGIRWCVIEARASDAAIRRRLRARAGKPDEISDARVEDFATLDALYEPPTELPADRWIVVNTTGALSRSVARALQELARRQAGDSGSWRRAGAGRAGEGARRADARRGHS